VVPGEPGESDVQIVRRTAHDPDGVLRIGAQAGRSRHLRSPLEQGRVEDAVAAATEAMDLLEFIHEGGTLQYAGGLISDHFSDKYRDAMKAIG
jgi:hypothetical protein